ncbi:MAG: sulfatase-like hydrolase/transferase [Giesbergeria sp.]
MNALRLLPVLLTLGAATTALHAESAKPNIILVMPDDVGYGDYACLGNPIIKTPATDGFWKESVRFTHFHVSPTCSPTRSAIMTGRHEFRNGVTHTILERERLALSATTLPQVLKTVGYTYRHLWQMASGRRGCLPARSTRL